MNIGIILCDRVADHLISEHGDYPEMYTNWLNLGNERFSYTFYHAVQGDIPQDINACDAYVISGSRHSVNDNCPWMLELQNFIYSLFINRKKLIGICFGHQIITKALGGLVSESSKGWGIGVSINPIIETTTWMKPKLEQIKLLVSHRDQVYQLAPESKVLAGSDFCPYYMLQIGEHFLTMQGHPEFSHAYTRALMELRKELMTTACFEQGLSSLSLESDSQIVANWVCNFLL